MNFLFGSLIGPLYSALLGLIAWGPWGKGLHSIIIRVYQRIFKIEWEDISEFETLGDFFLRKVNFKVAEAKLIAPAEAVLLDGPKKCESFVQVKRQKIYWSKFAELQHLDVQSFDYLNFYLAPAYYHWVHAVCDGNELSYFWYSGRHFPVNEWGRQSFPNLYSESQRLSFQWLSPEFGRIVCICVGAVGVSSIRSPWIESRSTGAWTLLHEPIQKAAVLAGFEMGSSVLMLVEKAPEMKVQTNRHFMVGESLLSSA